MTFLFQFSPSRLDIYCWLSNILCKPTCQYIWGRIYNTTLHFQSLSHVTASKLTLTASIHTRCPQSTYSIRFNILNKEHN
jgi:hypothetical protein